MSRGRHANPTVIGAFVLGAAVLVVVGMVVFGSGRFFRQEIEAVCYFAGSVNGLNTGAPVKFRGVPIGTVREIRMRLPPPEEKSPEELRIPVWIAIDLKQLAELRGQHVEVDRTRLDTLIAAGLRAQLQTESFVTGVLFVGLDYFPGSQVVLELPPDSGVLEIPTMPTTLEQAFEEITKVMARLDAVDIEALVTSIRHAADRIGHLAASRDLEETIVAFRDTLHSIQDVSRSVQPTLNPTLKDLQATTVRLRTTLAQLDDTLGRLRTVIDPQAPLAVELNRTLIDLGDAARRVGTFVQYLERNPNALITGRPQ